MVQIINKNGAGGAWGNILGTGLGAGLNQLAAHKLRELQHSKAAELYKKANYDPNTANLLAHLGAQHPSSIHNILMSLDKGGYNQGVQEDQQSPLDQSLGVPQAPQASAAPSPDQQVGFQQALSNSGKRDSESRGDTLKELQYRDKLQPTADVYQESLETIDNMLSLLNSKEGVGTGFIAHQTAKWSPSWLSNNSEEFDKDAAKYLNLATEGMKGVPSRLRIQFQEKEKPGLNHSPEVNRKILERRRNQIIKKQEEFYRTHPFMKPLEEMADQKRHEAQQKEAYIENGILYIDGKPVAKQIA